MKGFIMGFGDLTNVGFQKGGMAAGFRIETGCWTGNAGDASAHIPTTLTGIYSFVCNTAVANEIPDISDGFIKCGLESAPNGKFLNYTAIGY